MYKPPKQQRLKVLYILFTVDTARKPILPIYPQTPGDLPVAKGEFCLTVAMSFNSDQSSTPVRSAPPAHLQCSGISGRKVRRSSRKRKPTTHLTFDQDFRQEETLAKSARTSRSRESPQRASHVKQNTESRLKTRNGTQLSQGISAGDPKVREWTERSPRMGRLRASKGEPRRMKRQLQNHQRLG